MLAMGMPLVGAQAQTATQQWVTLKSGSTGAATSGTTKTLNWDWKPGGGTNPTISGTVDITRTGAGSHFIFSESHSSTISQEGFTASAYDNSTLANDLGGVTGINHFGSVGEGGRAGAFDGAATSTTVIDFKFPGTLLSPSNTILALFDPGSSNGATGPFKYKFEATLRGNAVDTSTWTATVVDPYTPAGTPGNFTWTASTATYDLSSFPSAAGGNFPDTVVFIDTKNTIFDRVKMTATGLSNDTVGLGIGSKNAARVLPSVAIRKNTRNTPGGAFKFTGTNLSATIGDITTTTADVLQPATPTEIGVTTIGAEVKLTETAATGYSQTGISCVDTNTTVSGNKTDAITLSGTGSITIPAASVVLGAKFVCDFTNAPDVDMTITKTNTPAAGASDQVSDTLIRGATTTYTLVVTNKGPGPVTGAVIKDTPGAGLTCASTNKVTLSGDGVPTGSFTVADLATGITLTKLDATKKTTLSFDCVVG